MGVGGEEKRQQSYLQVKRRRKDELLRIDDAVSMNGSVGEDADRLEMRSLADVANVDLEGSGNLVAPELGLVGDKGVEITVGLVVDRAIRIEVSINPAGVLNAVLADRGFVLPAERTTDGGIF